MSSSGVSTVPLAEGGGNHDRRQRRRFGADGENRGLFRVHALSCYGLGTGKLFFVAATAATAVPAKTTELHPDILLIKLYYLASFMAVNYVSSQAFSIGIDRTHAGLLAPRSTYLPDTSTRASQGKEAHMMFTSLA